MCLPLPPMRTHHPRRFRKNYKTAGIYSRKFLMLTMCQPECNVDPTGTST